MLKMDLVCIWSNAKRRRTSIGMCGLIKRDTLEDVDVGYTFLPKFWSKGYAVKSAQAVKEYAKNTIGLIE